MKISSVCFFVLVGCLAGCGSSATVESVSALCDTYCVQFTACNEENQNSVEDAAECSGQCMATVEGTSNSTCLELYQETLHCVMDLSCEDILTEGGTAGCLAEGVEESCSEASSQTEEVPDS